MKMEIITRKSDQARFICLGIGRIFSQAKKCRVLKQEEGGGESFLLVPLKEFRLNFKVQEISF